MLTPIRALRPLAALVLVGLVGCGGSDEPAGVDARFDDCHYDCFGGVTCVDGVFIVSNRTAIPCGPHLDEARRSPYGVCFHYGTKTPCATGLCTAGLCSDDYELHEDLVGSDAAAIPCLVQTSPAVGDEPTLTVGPEGEPLIEVANLAADAFGLDDDLTLTLVATLDPDDLTLSGAAASTQAVASATLYGAAALKPGYTYSEVHICRGALVATLSDGAEVRVVWASSIDCLYRSQPHQASCRVLHVPAVEAR